MIEIGLKARNGHKLRALLDGYCTGYPSQSEAELAVCSILAFYTQEESQIDRIYRGSKLYRAKWDEKHYGDGQTYGEATIRKALAGAREHYTDGGAEFNSQRNNKNEEWPAPKAIQAPLYPVPALDPNVLLPEALRDWIIDEADRMPCPPDFIAAAALVALGAIIGARCTIKPNARDDWLIVPNLWGGIVGIPSKKIPRNRCGAEAS